MSWCNPVVTGMSRSGFVQPLSLVSAGEMISQKITSQMLASSFLGTKFILSLVSVIHIHGFQYA